MDFWSYETSFEYVRHLRSAGKSAKADIGKMYRNMLLYHSARNDMNIVHTLVGECVWYCEGQPYYKVWPGIADQFIATRLDVPSELLRLPHSAFCIYLPKKPLLTFERGDVPYQVKTILIHDKHAYISIGDSVFGNGSIEHSTLFVQIRSEPIRPEHGTDDFSIMLYLRTNEGSTIEHAFSCAEGETDLPKSIIDACFRLTVGVCFLATGSHKILEYDVLAKHLEAYRRLAEDSPERKRLEEKARKRGKHGWSIGRGLDGRYLILPRGVTYEQAVREAGSRELLYQHTRGGHWRVQAYGEQWTKHRVIWIDEMLVRPDLLPKPLDPAA